MDHRLLSRTGVSVSKMCLGAMMFGRQRQALRPAHPARPYPLATETTSLEFNAVWTARGLLRLPRTVTVGRTDRRAEEVLMGVLVLLEMDGSTEAVLAAAVDLEARRPTSAKLAQAVAPTESGVVVATFWESAEARDAYQSEPEHREALQASGLLDSVTEMRSRVFEDAELKLA